MNKNYVKRFSFKENKTANNFLKCSTKQDGLNAKCKESDKTHEKT